MIDVIGYWISLLLLGYLWIGGIFAFSVVFGFWYLTEVSNERIKYPKKIGWDTQNNLKLYAFLHGLTSSFMVIVSYFCDFQDKVEVSWFEWVTNGLHYFAQCWAPVIGPLCFLMLALFCVHKLLKVVFHLWDKLDSLEKNS